MRSRLTRSTNLASSSQGGYDDQDRQKVPTCPDFDDCDIEENEEPLSGANEEKEEDNIVTVMLSRCATAIESLPPIAAKEMEGRLCFSQKVAQKLMDD